MNKAASTVGNAIPTPIKTRLPAPAQVAKFANSPAGGGLVTAGLGLGVAALDGQITGNEAAGAIGAGVGATAGSITGGAIGSLAGPVGTAIGSWVGGTIGAALGQALGQSLFPNRVGPSDAYRTAGPANFTGGQGYRVYYKLKVEARVPALPSHGKTVYGVSYRNVYGPISDIGPKVVYQESVRADVSAIRATYFGRNSDGEYIKYEDATLGFRKNNGKITGGISAAYHDDWEVTNIEIRRNDGLPDTDGDPPGVPIPVSPQGGITNPAAIAPSSPLTAPSSEPPTFPPIIPIPLIPALPGLPGTAPTNTPGPGPEKNTQPAKTPDFAPGGKTRPAGKPNAAPKANPSASGGKASPPPPNRTKKNSNCGCNKGILIGVENLLTGNAGNVAQVGLLAQIVNMLQSVSSVVGVGAFPISAPVNLNGKASGANKTINNLAEAHVWQRDNLDSTIGGWPNTIQNADTGANIENLTVSDSLAEIQGLLMAMAIGQGINQQGIFKTLTETTGIKQQSMLARQYAQANAEYLGYTLKQTSRQVPNTYTPGVENIMQLLNPGKIPMEAVENADDMDLQSCLRELCASAAIIRAVFFRNTGTEDIETALRQRLDQAKAVNAKGTDFEAYLQQVEQGFGLSQPYGRDASSGPRISDRTHTDTNQTP